MASNVTAVAAGAFHTLFLKSDGSLWAMGHNADGELGDGAYNQTNRPQLVVPGNVTGVAAGGMLFTVARCGHSLVLKNDGSLWAMGRNDNGQLGDGTNSNTNRAEQIVAGTPGYNRITWQFLSGGRLQLSFVGIAGRNYALERCFSLVPANWQPLVTNPAGPGGVLVFTNAPNPTTNNFWRIRSVP